MKITDKEIGQCLDSALKYANKEQKKVVEQYNYNMKENFKTETHYSINLTVNREFESLDVVQEENVVGRNAIKINLYCDRWRTVDDTIELLKKTIIAIEQNFK